MQLKDMTRQELSAFLDEEIRKYNEFKSRGLTLNMARGKPCDEQLRLSYGMLDCVTGEDSLNDLDGTDTRNYGGLDGIKSAKKLFADIFDVSENEVIVFGNSSLNIMYDTLVKAMLFGTGNGAKPWKDCGKIKWLCPVPGYDRHFLITEKLGFEMINVPCDENGPDMDVVERLVAEDSSIKGIWCVPMYSNPTGITYSDEVVKRMAAMKTAADDFRIFWDNAYCIHHLSDNHDTLLNLLEEAKKCGNEDRVYMFASTSKVTFAGGGIAAMSASEKNIEYIKSLITVQTIGYDKINQLRHVRFFKDFDGLTEHMKKHAELLAPRFNAVCDALDSEIKPLGIGKWVRPNGGYFVSFDAMEGCAKKIVQLCKEAGVELTGAGATFPYGKDPKDSNIRIAPSFPPIEELRLAAEVFCIAVKIASAQKLLEA